jgi:hypothetical protein
MHRCGWRSVVLVVVVGALAVACGAIPSSVPARQLDCDPGMAHGTCESVALAGIATMNREAIGQIDTVTVKGVDCEATGRAMFSSLEVGRAAHCWTVEIVGDSSGGHALIFQKVEGGALEPAQL